MLLLVRKYPRAFAVLKRYAVLRIWLQDRKDYTFSDYCLVSDRYAQLRKEFVNIIKDSNYTETAIRNMLASPGFFTGIDPECDHNGMHQFEIGRC